MQYEGTGKDPRFPVGQVFDIPDGDVEQQKAIEANGFGKRTQLVGQTGADNPARRAVELADADIRSDPMTHPQDSAIAESLTEDEERKIDAAHSEDAVSKRAENKVAKGADKHPADDGAGDETAGKRSTASRQKARDDAKSKGDE